MQLSNLFANKKFLFILLTVTSAIFLLNAYNKGMRADVNGDYYIYWSSGRNFISGQTLYTPGLVDGGFTYPPFAALFLSLFAWLPFHLSAFAFTFLVNYGLWVASAWLVRRIFKLVYPDQNITLPLILAVLLSAGFYWHNYMWMNSNLPVLCLTLLGIENFIKKNFTLSYLFFMAGTFLKITPVLFLFFAAIKRGPKDWLKMIATALPFIIIPMLFRGLDTGIKDWSDYFEAFLAPFSKGKVDENIISLGIPALLEKMNSGNEVLGYPSLLHLSAQGLKLLTLIIQVMIFGALTGKFLYGRYVQGKEEFSIADFCLIFLITLLLPGRVWGHHHVCASFIYTYLFMLIRDRKALLAITIVLCLLTEFTVKDVIGQTLCDLLRQYCYITLVMIFAGVLIIKFGYLKKQQALQV